MTRSYPTLLFLLAGLVACTGSSPKKDQQTEEKNVIPPEFVFTEDFHNFGTLQRGEIAVYNFLLINTGRTGFQIEKTETGCGCITIDYPEKNIAPGDSVYIAVSLDTGGEIGRVYQEIRVWLSGVRQESKLAVAAHVNDNWEQIK